MQTFSSEKGNIIIRSSFYEAVEKWYTPPCFSKTSVFTWVVLFTDVTSEPLQYCVVVWTHVLAIISLNIRPLKNIRVLGGRFLLY